MKNLDDEIRQILRNMYSNSKSYLNEGDDNELKNFVGNLGNNFSVPGLEIPQFDINNITNNITKTTKLTDEGNTYLQDKKIKDCITGKEYISRNITPTEKFERAWTKDEWYGYNSRKLQRGETNDISACEYYAIILGYQWNNSLGMFKDKTNKIKPNYDSDFTTCIGDTFTVTNQKPLGCTTKFSYFDNTQEFQGGSRLFTEVSITNPNWFATEYQKFRQDENYTTLPPSIVKGEKKYSFVVGGEVTQTIELDKLGINDSSDDETLTKKSMMYGQQKELTLELPLTDDEKNMLDSIPINQKGEFIGGEYVCKKTDAPLVNIRTTPEVNEDKGVLDPSDNYINWSSDEVIGKYIKYERKDPAIYVRNNGAPLNIFNDEQGEELRLYIEKLKKDKGSYGAIIKYGLYSSNVPSELKTELGVYLDSRFEEEYKSYAKHYAALVLTHPSNYNYLPKEVYDGLPETAKSQIWYNIELDKELLDMSEYTDDYYKNGWVCGSVTKMCEKTSETTAETNYDMEVFKRMPMKPFANP